MLTKLGRKQKNDVSYFEVQSSRASERWSLMQGQVLAVRPGAIGSLFAQWLEQGHVRRLDALPHNVTPIAFDPAVLDKGPRPPVAKQKQLMREEVRERFGWSESQMREAEAMAGFPKPSGSVVSRAGIAPAWHERFLVEWVAAIKRTAATLASR